MVDEIWSRAVDTIFEPNTTNAVVFLDTPKDAQPFLLSQSDETVFLLSEPKSTSAQLTL